MSESITAKATYRCGSHLEKEVAVTIEKRDIMSYDAARIIDIMLAALDKMDNHDIV